MLGHTVLLRTCLQSPYEPHCHITSPSLSSLTTLPHFACFNTPPSASPPPNRLVVQLFPSRNPDRLTASLMRAQATYVPTPRHQTPPRVALAIGSKSNKFPGLSVHYREYDYPS